MGRRKSPDMKEGKGWALVDKATGEMNIRHGGLRIYTTRDSAFDVRYISERIVRVKITEIRK